MREKEFIINQITSILFKFDTFTLMSIHTALKNIAGKKSERTYGSTIIDHSCMK